jgi:undecaprenyl-diphosphatase
MPATSTRAEAAPVRAPLPLHDAPPITPAGLLLRHRVTVPAIVGSFVVLGVLALVAHSTIPLTWDEPIQRWVEGHRTAALDDFFLYMSRFGGLHVVLTGLALLLALVLRTCRPMFFLLLAATLARPAVEWTLKVAVDRDRPDLDRMVPGNGPSFPSGHVMAAIALWGLVPPVVALVTHRRFWWWVATIVSAFMIVTVAAARVYLGVHWFTDVVGALLFGAIYLLVVEWCFDWGHRHYPCDVFLDLESKRRDDTDRSDAGQPDARVHSHQ